MSDWFDPIPAGWTEARLKSVIASTQTGVWGSDPKNDSDDVLCVRVADFDRPKHRVGAVETLRSVPAKEQHERLLQPGDILLEKSGGTDRNPVGFTVLFEGQYPAVSSNFVTRLRLCKGHEPRFWLYALAASYSTGLTARSVRRTTGIQNLDSSTYFNEKYPCPPLARQVEIADYLDRETAQIDNLIAEQERLIELLDERRRSAIAEAVMPTGNPLNDSHGWPKVGHSWDVTLGKMLDAGKAVPSGSVSLPYVRAGNIQDTGLDLSTVNQMPFSSEEANFFELRAGDLLVVEGGAVGTNVTLDEDMPGWAFQKTVNRLRPSSDTCSRWLGYVLRTYRDVGIIDIVCNKSTIAHLTAEKLRGLTVPPTSPVEQKRIATALDDAVEHIDSLVRETRRFIELARERRSALITAAVTGQIEIPEAS